MDQVNPVDKMHAFRTGTAVRHLLKALHRVGVAVRFLRRGELSQLAYIVTARYRGLDLIPKKQDELGTDPKLSAWYSDSGGPDLDAVLNALNVVETDSVVDIGCGKGGALITLAKHPFQELVGVEISSELVRIAERNISIAQIKNCRIVKCDAAAFEDYDQFTYVYFYNPFSCKIMRIVISQLEMSLLRSPRNLTLIYNNPICHQIVTANSYFHAYRTFNLPRGRNPIIVYRHERGTAGMVGR